MEEIKEESCSTGSKKCCIKGIIIVVLCSVVCFFLGYYLGNKSNSNISRAVGPSLNRPFSPGPRMSAMPNRAPRPPMSRLNGPKMPSIKAPNMNAPRPTPPQLKKIDDSQVQPRTVKPAQPSSKKAVNTK